MLIIFYCFKLKLSHQDLRTRAEIKSDLWTLPLVESHCTSYSVFWHKPSCVDVLYSIFLTSTLYYIQRAVFALYTTSVSVGLYWCSRCFLSFILRWVCINQYMRSLSVVSTFWYRYIWTYLEVSLMSWVSVLQCASCPLAQLFVKFFDSQKAHYSFY